MSRSQATKIKVLDLDHTSSHHALHGVEEKA
jgi:hypothetical protein